MLSDNTIGGQVYKPLLKTMYRDVAYANNSKLTDTLQNWHFYLLKGQSQLDHLQTAPWILSQTFLADRFDSILVMVNQGLSKGVILMPCNKTITSEGTARLLLENLYKRFGLLDKIISDRGPQFALKAFQELMKQLGINSALSTPYHPQTDGTTEWVNQEIKAYLSIYCTSHPEEWPTTLHTLEFIHNNRRHAERQKTPFELIFRDSPIAIPHSFENTKFPAIEE